MISYRHPSGTVCLVAPICWTPGGRIRCRRSGRLNAFYAVEVTSLDHPAGPKALATLLRSLP